MHRICTIGEISHTHFHEHKDTFTIPLKFHDSIYFQAHKEPGKASDDLKSYVKEIVATFGMEYTSQRDWIDKVTVDPGSNTRKRQAHTKRVVENQHQAQMTTSVSQPSIAAMPPKHKPRQLFVQSKLDVDSEDVTLLATPKIAPKSGLASAPSSVNPQQPEQEASTSPAKATLRTRSYECAFGYAHSLSTEEKLARAKEADSKIHTTTASIPSNTTASVGTMDSEDLPTKQTRHCESKKCDCPSTIRCVTYDDKISYVYTFVRHNHDIDASVVLTYHMHPKVREWLEAKLAETHTTSQIMNALDNMRREWSTSPDQHPWYAPVSELDTRFFPTDQTIRNFLAQAAHRVHVSPSDAKSAQHTCDTWNANHPNDKVYFRAPTGPRNKGFFLAVFLQHHRHIMIKYANRRFGVDSTFKTNIYGFSLFTISIIDSSGQTQIAGMFLTASEEAEDIQEGLQWFKDECADWKPESVVIDKSDSEKKALEAVFPGIKIQYCNFHRLQAVWRVINAARLDDSNKHWVFRAFQHLGEVWEKDQYEQFKKKFR